VNQVGPSGTAHGSSELVKAHTPRRGRHSCCNTLGLGGSTVEAGTLLVAHRQPHCRVRVPAALFGPLPTAALMACIGWYGCCRQQGGGRFANTLAARSESIRVSVASSRCLSGWKQAQQRAPASRRLLSSPTHAAGPDWMHTRARPHTRTREGAQPPLALAAAAPQGETRFHRTPLLSTSFLSPFVFLPLDQCGPVAR
jgi:hypothetical protein